MSPLPITTGLILNYWRIAIYERNWLIHEGFVRAMREKLYNYYVALDKLARGPYVYCSCIGVFLVQLFWRLSFMHCCHFLFWTPSCLEALVLDLTYPWQTNIREYFIGIINEELPTVTVSINSIFIFLKSDSFEKKKKSAMKS